MSNLAIFRNYIQEKGLALEEVAMENGATAFRGKESLEGGGRIVFAMIFNAEEDILDIQIFDIAQIQDPLKKESKLELLNELNMSYRFIKFLATDDGFISSETSIPLGSRPILAEELVDQLILLINIVENAYPKFMKLQWG